ncbi:M24 family metallopeptidase [Bremerella cremea]|uniref:M24 family metallopeptidase n=1 Tax=Bremerella cremea TaxID=1031537 RepID=A0A368KMA5_9BACT|nr:M24 family metallopeptidase [Bremerella cremea]RCS43238.1 M24 family metallopeptidase [Bremerella cremea]
MNPNRHVQSIARSVLTDLGPTIQVNDTEQTIAARCVAMMRDQGIERTWYYDCPAYVLLGSRSCLSISGRDYVPAEEPVGNHNVVTIDLSPLYGEAWGDCARTFYVEAGTATQYPTRPDFSRGHDLLQALHALAYERVHAETTFEQLHAMLAQRITSDHFESIDFLGNFGHSIVTHLNERIYIEAGNQARLADVAYFTIEPHIREIGGNWGYKWEEVYTVGEAGQLVML